MFFTLICIICVVLKINGNLDRISKKFHSNLFFNAKVRFTFNCGPNKCNISILWTFIFRSNGCSFSDVLKRMSWMSGMESYGEDIWTFYDG